MSFEPASSTYISTLSSSTCNISSPPPSPSQDMTATSNNSLPTDLHQTASFSSQSSTSRSLDGAGIQSSRSDCDTFAESDSRGGANVGAPVDVDPQIVEALKSKDRIYVLKLGEQMETLINDRRSRIDLTPTTSYQRLLVHRCSAYYKLAPDTDPVTKVISVSPTLESRIPAWRIAELVPAQSIAQPAIKIMQRSITDRTRSKPHSQAGSVAGEDAELSDVEPSESGSLGGRSNTTGSSKKHKTIAEREAAYNEARSRIFMGFEEKDKNKDLSASSSTVSLTSGSVTSAGETSSTGDLDDSVSSPATESEWSGPVVRDRKDGRRSNGSSSRSLRSGVPVFNGPSSSRGSRAPSPSSFKYPTLYEPSPGATPYDGSQPPVQSPGYVNPYLYAYPQSAAPAPNYVAPYPYYAPYPYPHPQTPIHHADTGGPSSQPDMYSPPQHPPHQGVYVPFPWHSSPAQQHSSPHPPASHQPHQAPNPSIAPPASQYSGYTPPVPAYGPYPMPAYYPTPPPIHHMQPSPSPTPNHTHYSPEYNNGHDGYSPARSYPGGIVGPQSPTMKPRGAPPARSAWSYGPGVGMGGFGMNNVSNRSGAGGGEVVGPRLSSTVRRAGTMNTSFGGRTPAGDEASSTASSTSSSSRRTTTSSQHPLPARPDWAVGLKPQPTLHSIHPRHHDHSMGTRNMSPARNNGQRGQQAPPVLLQSADFPPLTSISSATEKRAPTVAGVWNNSSSTRAILMPANNANTSQGNALVNHGNLPAVTTGPPSNTRSEELEVSPHKGGTELFNPKGIWKSGTTHSRSPAPQDRAEKDTYERERLRGEAVANAILVGKVAMLTVEENEGPVNPTRAVSPVALAT